MKKNLLVFVAIIISFNLAFATANDVEIFKDVQFSVNGHTFILDRQFSTDTLTVNATDFSITTTAGAIFHITSVDKLDFTVSPESYKRAVECESSLSRLKVEADPGISATITITPLSTTCSGGGGGAPGGTPSGSISAAPSASGGTVTPTVVSAPTVVSTPSTATVSAVFSVNLNMGSRGADVTRIQTLLATDKSIYPEGTVSGYYGKLTTDAVRRFQLKYGVIKKATDGGNGRLGPATRAKIQEVFGGNAASSIAPVTIAPVTIPSADISALQKQLDDAQKLLQILIQQLNSR